MANDERVVITEESLNNYVVTGTFVISGSTRPDAESTEKKKFTLEVEFDNVPVKDIVTKALEPAKITKVNNHLRPKFDTWKSGDKFTISFKSPGKATPTKLERIQELAKGFMAQGIDEDTAMDLATKVVENPKLLVS